MNLSDVHFVATLVCVFALGLIIGSWYVSR